MSEQNLSRTKRSSQAIDNFSFDDDFLVKVTELVRRNEAGTAIEYFSPATEEKQDSIITAIRPLSGAGANGTVALTSANTWYAVPSTVPTSDYVLVATIENGLGTVRFGFSNSGTPSTTNGNPAPGELTVKLAANQSIYYASSTAGDDINWTTKIL